MKHALNLGKAEMDVLRYVAENGPVTVRQAADDLGQSKGHVRTTVLNTMERLRQKGFIRREKAEGVYTYAPVEGKIALFQRLLKGFIDAAFGGSHAPLVTYFAEEGKLTPEELKTLQRIADRIESTEQ